MRSIQFKWTFSFIFLFSFCFYSNAQSNLKAPYTDQSTEQRINKNIENLDNIVNLSESQRAQAMQFAKEMQSEMQANRMDRLKMQEEMKNLSPEDRKLYQEKRKAQMIGKRKEMQTKRKAYYTNIKSILTADQAKLLEKKWGK